MSRLRAAPDLGGQRRRSPRPIPTRHPASNPNYLTTDYDRTVTANLMRRARELFAQSPIADRIDHEMSPGPGVQSDDELIDTALDDGYTGYHAVGSCAMGPSDDDVVDDRLRVRGVDGLRVVDCSSCRSCWQAT